MILWQIIAILLAVFGVELAYIHELDAAHSGPHGFSVTVTTGGGGGGSSTGNCDDGATADACVILGPTTKTLVSSQGTWSLADAVVNNSLYRVMLNGTGTCCSYTGGVDGAGFADAIMLAQGGKVFVRGWERLWYRIDGANNHTQTATTAAPSYTTTIEPAWITKNAGDAAVNINIAAPTNNLYSQANLTHAIYSLPTNGTVLLADGVTPVTAEQSLSQAQLTSLKFKPTTTALNVSQDSSFVYVTTDPAQQGAIGTASFTILPSTSLWADPAITLNSNTIVFGQPVDFYPALMQPSQNSSTIDRDVVAVRFQNPSGSTEAAGFVYFGHTFRPGDLQTTDTLCGRLSSGGGDTVYVQKDVKATNQDGSVRLAILSASVPSLAPFGSLGDHVDLMLHKGASCSATPPTSAPNAATIAAGAYDLNATIAYQSGACTVSGSTTSTDTVSAKAILAAANSGGTTTQWLSGPVVNAYTAKGSINGGKARAQVDIYAFSDGTFQTDFIVDNTWGFTPGKTDLKYNISFSQDGFSQTPVCNPLYTRYPHPVMVGRITPNIQYDVPYLVATRLVPNYDLSFGIAENKYNGYTGILVNGMTTFTPIMNGVNDGNIDPDWGDVGDRPDLAPLTAWETDWLIGQHYTAFKIMMANAYNASAAAVYFRDESTDLPINGETHPNLRSGESLANGDPCSPSGGTVCPGGTLMVSMGENPQAHRPDLTFLPGILSGNHYLNELWIAFENQAILLDTQIYGTSRDVSGNYPAGAFAAFGWNQGLLGDGGPGPSGIQPRHPAWNIRDVGRLAAYLPDAHGLKQYAKNEIAKVYAEANNYIANKFGITDFGQQAGTMPPQIGNGGALPPAFETFYGYTGLDAIVHMQLPTGSASLAALMRFGGTGYGTGLVTSGQLGLPAFEGTTSSYNDSAGVLCGPTGQVICDPGRNQPFSTISQLFTGNISGSPVDSGTPGFHNQNGEFSGHCQGPLPGGGGVQGGFPEILMAATANIVSVSPEVSQAWHAYTALALGTVHCYARGGLDLVAGGYQQIPQFAIVPRMPDGNILAFTNWSTNTSGNASLTCPRPNCLLGEVVETGQSYNLSSTNASGLDLMVVFAVGGMEYGATGVGGGGGPGSMAASASGADSKQFGGCGAGLYVGGAGEDLIVPGANCWVGTGPAPAGNTIQFSVNSSKPKQIGYTRTVWGVGTTAGRFRTNVEELQIKASLNGRSYTPDGKGGVGAAQFTSHCSVSGNDTRCDLGNGSIATFAGQTAALTSSVRIIP